MHDILDRNLDLYDRFNTVRLQYGDTDEPLQHKEALVATMGSLVSAFEATEWHHMDRDRVNHGINQRIEELEKIQSELNQELPDQAIDGLGIVISELRGIVDDGLPSPSFGETWEELVETAMEDTVEVAELIRQVLEQAKIQSKHLHHLEENAFE